MNASTQTDRPAGERSLRSEARLIRRGIAWNAVGTTLSKACSILAKLILARLLLPEHFGFVSMVIVFTSLTKVIADLGFRLALIQRRCGRQTKDLYDSAFWLLLVAAVLMLAVMWVVGVPLISWFYGEPRLGPVALALSSVVIFQNLQVVPEARLARISRFKQLAYADIAGMVVGYTAAILLAMSGAGVWSLVTQTLVTAALTSALTFAYAGWRPSFHFDRALVAELLSFSKFIVGSRLLISLQQNLDYLLIGKLVGAQAVGIYSIAFLLTETLRAQAYWLVSKAVYPFYSRASARQDDVRTVYLATMRYLSLAVFPAATLLLFFAPDLIPFAFTSKWSGAVQPVQILSLASMIVASGGTPSEVLRGIGRPDVDYRINLWVSLGVAVPLLYAGTLWLGIVGTALAVATHSLVARLSYATALHRLLGLSAAEQFESLRPALLGSAAIAIVPLLLGPGNWVLELLLAAAAYAAVTLPTVLPHLRAMSWSWRGGRGAPVRGGSASTVSSRGGG
ncbi:lipopolysaccharide biosynthesis protein [Sphingomonas swuensis]|uniref:Lipopolysaccharide biosynthesis protein n=1 Tax=Sphingomonas swuensis TaxID=977800 RepID=A0ABP7T006_9SPHN